MPLDASDYAASTAGVYFAALCTTQSPGGPAFTNPATGACANAADPASFRCAFGSGGGCVACPDGGLCPGGSRVWSRPGYYVASQALPTVLQCAAPNPTARCTGWNATTGACVRTRRPGLVRGQHRSSWWPRFALHFSRAPSVCRPHRLRQCVPLRVLHVRRLRRRRLRRGRRLLRALPRPAGVLGALQRLPVDGRGCRRVCCAAVPCDRSAPGVPAGRGLGGAEQRCRLHRARRDLAASGHPGACGGCTSRGRARPSPHGPLLPPCTCRS